VSEGEIYLKNLGFKSEREWIGYGVLYLVGMWGAMLVLTMMAMHFIRWGGRSTVPLPTETEKEEEEEEEEEKVRVKASVRAMVVPRDEGGVGYQRLVRIYVCVYMCVYIFSTLFLLYIYIHTLTILPQKNTHTGKPNR
jgi:hypothetical protein